MIYTDSDIFQLNTQDSSYIFRVTKTGHLEHLYFGGYLEKITGPGAEAMCKKSPFGAGNVISYDKDHPEVVLEDLCLEMSGPGKGDIREPFIELIHHDGTRTCDFLFEKAELISDKPEYETLPGSYGLKENEHLCVTLKEKAYGLTLQLHYYVYEECNVICKSAKLINNSDKPVRINRLLSGQLDLSGSGYVMTTFTGAWAREMERTDTPLLSGTHSISSCCGSSSNRANPFFMISRPETGEASGECYGFNLIYSGNHFEAACVSSFGKTRILNGINPQGFSWLLDPGESFEAPESIASFSSLGHRQLSLNMHSFISEHIVRGAWKNRPRPVLVNSWEAFYFDFDESKLLKLARAAKNAGCELFVLDDGWFGKRDDPSSSLGDWRVNKDKLPSGLKSLAKKINAKGLDFGLWIEPEMVSTDSKLYSLHPGWTMEIPNMPHSEGRDQRVLDLANPEVVDFLTKIFIKRLSSANISYVKWDMNRIFSDVYSPYLSAESQGETAHRYMLGLYRLMDALTKAFPDILFEGCAAGGGRFDLGILCYFPQIWASDNTDPVCRAKIQEGYSFGYPLSCMGAHVSASPNHQTARSTSVDTRFNIAAFAVLGYELNLLELNKKELKKIKELTALYKKWRTVFQYGNFYRIKNEKAHCWLCVSKEKTKAAGMIDQDPSAADRQSLSFVNFALDPKAKYRFYSLHKEPDIKSPANGSESSRPSLEFSPELFFIEEV